MKKMKKINALKRHVNGLKFVIQDEISLHKMHFVEEAYHPTLKVEEKLLHKDNRKNFGRGRGGSGSKGHNSK
jgi:hypothetical protein